MSGGGRQAGREAAGRASAGGEGRARAPGGRLASTPRLLPPPPLTAAGPALDPPPRPRVPPANGSPCPAPAALSSPRRRVLTGAAALRAACREPRRSRRAQGKVLSLASGLCSGPGREVAACQSWRGSASPPRPGQPGGGQAWRARRGGREGAVHKGCIVPPGGPAAPCGLHTERSRGCPGGSGRGSRQLLVGGGRRTLLLLLLLLRLLTPSPPSLPLSGDAPGRGRQGVPHRRSFAPPRSVQRESEGGGREGPAASGPPALRSCPAAL